MIHFFYILFSASSDTFYIGETCDVDFRLHRHNSHVYKGGFTKIATDWEVVLSYQCNNKSDALYLESFVKRMKSRKFIQKNMDDNTILTDIISKR